MHLVCKELELRCIRISAVSGMQKVRAFRIYAIQKISLFISRLQLKGVAADNWTQEIKITF